MKHHAHTAVSPSAPKGVVPRDEGIRVSGERSTTPAQPEAPPFRRSPALTPGRRLIQFRLAPAHPAGGYLSRRQPRSRAGGRKVRTSGAGMVSNPSAAGGPTYVPHTRPEAPRTPGRRLPKPATASPTGRRPESPNQWRGHGVESLGGRRPQQAGTPTRPRPAEASSKPAPAPPGRRPAYAPSGSAAIAKPVNQKTGSSRIFVGLKSK